MNARQRALGAALSVLLSASASAPAGEPRSTNYRLIAPGIASVAAPTQSPVASLLVVGGAGQATGISASENTSVVAGGTSATLPTHRVFRDGLES